MVGMAASGADACSMEEVVSMLSTGYTDLVDFGKCADADLDCADADIGLC